MLKAEILTTGHDPDCGCPEETGLIWPFEYILHIEPDGTGEAFLDCGDFDFELSYPDVKSMDDLRGKVTLHIETMCETAMEEWHPEAIDCDA